MLGLREYSEEDFTHFKGTNLRYIENLRQLVGGFTSCICIIMLSIFFFAVVCKLEISKLIGIITFIIALFGIFICYLPKINNGKYVYKFQKTIVISEILIILILSISLYLLPIIVVFNQKLREHMMKLIYLIILLGYVYTIILLFKNIKLIKKGETRVDKCDKLYGKLGEKIIYIGFSIPLIAVVSILGKRLSVISIYSGGIDIAPIIITSIFALIMQIVISIFIPEAIILLYCKFRFESFNIPYKEEGPPVFKGVDKNKYKQPKKKRKY